LCENRVEPVDGPPARCQYRVASMATLRRIQTASMRVAPHWFLCVFLGAFVALQLASPSALIL